MRIPPTPGLWRADVLLHVSGDDEGGLPIVTTGEEEQNEVNDDLETANEKAFQQNKLQGTKSESQSRLQVVLANLVVGLCTVPAFFIVVVGAQRIGSQGSCERPVATLILLDGLLLFLATLGGGGFKVNARRFSAKAGTWVFPLLSVALIFHIVFVALLIAALAAVDYIGSSNGDNNNSNSREREYGCSSGTYAWGVFFVAIHLLCLAAPPTIMCVRCWRRATSPPLAVVIREEDNVRGGMVAATAAGGKEDVFGAGKASAPEAATTNRVAGVAMTTAKPATTAHSAIKT